MINNLIVYCTKRDCYMTDKDYMYLRKKYTLFVVYSDKEIISASEKKFKKYINSISLNKILIENNLSAHQTIVISDSENIYNEAKNNNLDFYTFLEYKKFLYSKTYIRNIDVTMFLDYGVGEISHSLENKTFYSAFNSGDKINYLLFFDSRGLAIDDANNCDNALMQKMISKLETDGKSYLAICRPKNVTIFATLINFLKSNNLEFEILISNLGFVDYTPKKNSLIYDMKKQISMSYSNNVGSVSLEKYTLANGTKEELQTLLYDNKYIQNIQNILIKRFNKIFLLNTTNFPKSINIQRKRPGSFFEQIAKTNTLIKKIVKVDCDRMHLIDISTVFKNNYSLYTFDAVHYTSKGHKVVYDFLLEEGVI